MIHATNRVDKHELSTTPDQLLDRVFALKTIQPEQYLLAKVKGAIGKLIERPMARWLGIDRQATRLAVRFDVLHIVQELGEAFGLPAVEESVHREHPPSLVAAEYAGDPAGRPGRIRSNAVVAVSVTRRCGVTRLTR